MLKDNKLNKSVLFDFKPLLDLSSCFLVYH